MAMQGSVAMVVAGMVVLLLTAFSAMPPVVAGVSPMGFLLGVLLFALVAPGTMPVVVIVALSLVADTMLGAPLGLHGLVALIVVLVGRRYGRVIPKQRLGVMVLKVALLLLVAQLVMCGLLLVLGSGVSWMSALLSWLVTLPLVPVVGWMVLRMTGQE